MLKEILALVVAAVVVDPSKRNGNVLKIIIFNTLVFGRRQT